jgi:TusA-related sulfurtransferase
MRRFLLERAITLVEPTTGCDSIDPESSDWYYAVTLSERIDSVRQRQSLKVKSNDEIIQRRLERWHSEFQHELDDFFSHCLAIHKITKSKFLHILGEPIEDVRGYRIRTLALGRSVEDSRTLDPCAPDIAVIPEELRKNPRYVDHS